MPHRTEDQKTRLGSAPRVVVALVLTLAIGLGATPASAERPSAPNSLRSAMRNGVVDPSVLEVLQEQGHVEALVSVDGAQTLAGASGPGVSSQAGSAAGVRSLLRKIEPAYEELKSELPEAGEVVEDFEALPTTLVRFDSEEGLLAAAQDPSVISIQADAKMRINLSQSLPLVRQPQAAAAGHRGAGTSVAILDTGVDYSRSAFGSCAAPGGSCKVAYAQDFAPDDGLRDTAGHGTNVAAVALGVAPAAKVLSLDVVDGNYALSSDVIAAINWSMQNKDAYGIAAVNMSLGDATYHTTSCSTSAFAAPFANLRAAGILPVVAAGNYASKGGGFHDGISGPACAPGAISVGAVYDSQLGKVQWGDCTDKSAVADRPTCFSQSGSLLSVWAPGAHIAAGGYTLSGTSQATPHVAGAVAVAAAADPTATSAEITAAIENNGPVVTDGRNGVSKHRLDVAAVAAEVVGDGPVPPSPTPDPGPDPVPTEDPGVSVTGKFARYRGVRGEYFLVGSRRNARYAGKLVAALGDQTMTLEEQHLVFQLERKRVDGTWAMLSDESLALNGNGSARLTIRNRSLRPGARYRIHASYPGDESHPPVDAEFSYFRLR